MPQTVLTEPPCFMDIDSVYSGDEMARVFKGIVGEGVVSAGDLAVTQRSSGATMGIDIAPGAAWVEGDDSALLQPVYHQVITATVGVSVDAADGSNPRIDRVVLAMEDATFDSSGQRRAKVEVITGTPASSPSAPAEPDSAITLATIAVATGATIIEDADITDLRPRAGLLAAFLLDDSVGTGILADAAVTTAKLADGDVTTAKLDDLAATTAKIANAAVTTAKLASPSTSSVTLANGWQSTGNGGPVQQVVEPGGRVFLRGEVFDGGSGNPNVGFVPTRPASDCFFACATGGGNVAVVKIRASDGLISDENGATTFDFSGITYRAA
ncbi:MAG: hypothetical protein RIB67_07450 [Miltoncostaeaceae bacterium]